MFSGLIIALCLMLNVEALRFQIVLETGTLNGAESRDTIAVRFNNNNNMDKYMDTGATVYREKGTNSSKIFDFDELSDLSDIQELEIKFYDPSKMFDAWSLDRVWIQTGTETRAYDCYCWLTQECHSVKFYGSGCDYEDIVTF
ncbi:uncharacterized protein LOC142348806 [Convolutriloba macropyga]|uniref:uncharacterized protein LOC142348806 n=1 Tax=Convolutriloba macropyga TaxID=536237 RepID=UPI003F51DB90